MDENPGTLKVYKMLEEIDNGNYVIPYFQRGFEWNAGMICDLLESIAQGYYTGLILLWSLNKEQVKNEKWDPVWGSKVNATPNTAILDGQQRLSSLYYAVYNPKKIFPNRNSYYLFYINIKKILFDEFENSFSYYYYYNYQNWESILNSKDEWLETGIFPLSILNAKDRKNPHGKYINSEEFSELLTAFVDKNKASIPQETTVFRIYQIFNSILNYDFVVYPLSSDRSLYDICNIFAKVNAKGMKLSTFDLMNAFLYTKGIRLRKDLWENLENETLKNIDKNMGEYLLKLISLVKQNYCSAKYIFNLIPGSKTKQRDEAKEIKEVILVESDSEFKKLWDKSYKYADLARQIIMSVGEYDFGAIKTDFIPNTTIIPVLGAFLWE